MAAIKLTGRQPYLVILLDHRHMYSIGLPVNFAQTMGIKQALIMQYSIMQTGPETTASEKHSLTASNTWKFATSIYG